MEKDPITLFTSDNSFGRDSFEHKIIEDDIKNYQNKGKLQYQKMYGFNTVNSTILEKSSVHNLLTQNCKVVETARRIEDIKVYITNY